jgi:hypothetical protein
MACRPRFLIALMIVIAPSGCTKYDPPPPSLDPSTLTLRSVAVRFVSPITGWPRGDALHDTEGLLTPQDRQAVLQRALQDHLTKFVTERIGARFAGARNVDIVISVETLDIPSAVFIKLGKTTARFEARIAIVGSDGIVINEHQNATAATFVGNQSPYWPATPGAAVEDPADDLMRRALVDWADLTFVQEPRPRSRRS